MSMQWVFIQPQDVWMFRDSKPFVAQQNFVARTMFPPHPGVMQGVIRSYYLENQGVNWKRYAAGEEDPALYAAVGGPAINGQGPSLGALQISGPFVARKRDEQGDVVQVERLYPAPADLLYSEKQNAYRILRPAVGDDFYTDPPFEGWRPLLSDVAGGDFKEATGWLTEGQFAAYLTGNVDAIQGAAVTSIYDVEERVGLAINRQRRAAEEHHLYHARFARPCDDIGLLVGVNQDIFKGSGVLNIGGESRSGYYQRTDYQPPEKDTSGNLKVVLLTPAYFRDGQQPVDGDWSPWVGDGRPISFAARRPLEISGWDMARQRPKPLRRLLPAGTVFYFEDAALSGQSFTETPPNEANFGAMGYGAFASTVWA